MHFLCAQHPAINKAPYYQKQAPHYKWTVDIFREGYIILKSVHFMLTGYNN